MSTRYFYVNNYDSPHYGDYLSTYECNSEWKVIDDIEDTEGVEETYFKAVCHLEDNSYHVFQLDITFEKGVFRLLHKFKSLDKAKKYTKAQVALLNKSKYINGKFIDTSKYKLDASKSDDDDYQYIVIINNDTYKYYGL